jgi:hypothetical protein
VQPHKRAGLLGHLEAHQHFAALTNLSALGNEAKTAKVHVAT